MYVRLAFVKERLMQDTTAEIKYLESVRESDRLGSTRHGGIREDLDGHQNRQDVMIKKKLSLLGIVPPSSDQ
jgi:hypothetical protein